MHEEKGKQLHHVWSRAFWDVVHGSEMVDCKDVVTLNMETETCKDFFCVFKNLGYTLFSVVLTAMYLTI